MESKPENIGINPGDVVADNASQNPGPSADQGSSEKHEETMMTSSDFAELSQCKYYVDKTLMIPALFSDSSMVVITAPSHSGKSVLMSTVKYFVEIQVDDKGQPLSDVLSKEGNEALITDTTNYKLFKGRVVHKYPVMYHFGKYPVIHLDFRCTKAINSINDVGDFVRDVIQTAYRQHSYLVHSSQLSTGDKKYFNDWLSDVEYKKFQKNHLAMDLVTLSDLLKKHFKKSSYVLIDDYDSVIINTIRSQALSEEEISHIHSFITNIYLYLLKSSHPVSHALVTGISMIIGVWSDVNNVTRRMYHEKHRYNWFYGLTEFEINELFTKFQLDNLESVKKAYFNCKIDGRPKMYNIYSVMRYLQTKKLENYWESTPILGMHESFRGNIISMIERLLRGCTDGILISEIISRRELLSLSNLFRKSPDRFPVSRLVLQFFLEQGCLTIVPRTDQLETYQRFATLKIPNDDLAAKIKADLLDFYETIGDDKQSIREECVKGLKAVYEAVDNVQILGDKFKFYFGKLRAFSCAVYGDNESLNDKKLRRLFITSAVLNYCHQDLKLRSEKNLIWLPVVEDVYRLYYYAAIFESNGNEVGLICNFSDYDRSVNAAHRIFQKGYLNIIMQSEQFKKVSKLLILGLCATGKGPKMSFEICYGVIDAKQVKKISVNDMKQMKIQ